MGDEDGEMTEATESALEITQGSPAPIPDATPAEQPSSMATPDGSEPARQATPDADSATATDESTPGSVSPRPGRMPVPARERPLQPADQADPTVGSDEASAPGDGTTGGLPAEDEDMPADDASPEATTETALVDSCEPAQVPEFTGENDAFIVVEDLNFRTGPGVDCDLVGDSLLESGTALTVTSDPVVRAGEDPEWVRVDVEGEDGWVAVDFIEPEAE